MRKCLTVRAGRLGLASASLVLGCSSCCVMHSPGPIQKVFVPRFSNIVDVEIGVAARSAIVPFFPADFVVVDGDAMRTPRLI